MSLNSLINIIITNVKARKNLVVVVRYRVPVNVNRMHGRSPFYVTEVRYIFLESAPLYSYMKEIGTNCIRRKNQPNLSPYRFIN